MLQATTNLYTSGMVARVEAKSELPTGTAPEDANTKPPGDEESQTGWLRWRNDALELYGVNYRFSSIVYDERTPLGTSQDAKDHALARAYAGYEGSGSLAAGDRLPDAPGLLSLSGPSHTKWTLLDLFKTSKHTVLVFPDAGSDDGASVLATRRVVDLAKTYPAEIVQAVVLVPARKAHAFPPMETPDGSVTALVDLDGHARSAYRVGQEMAVVAARPDGYVGAVALGTGVDGVKRYFEMVFDA